MKFHKVRNMVINKILLASLFFLSAANGYAQENSGCLSKHQLIKMQSSSLDDIRLFLSNESWSFNSAKSNQSYNYFDYPINYNIVSWEKSSYYNGDNIILYNSTGKPNIVIYQSSSSCFNDLLKSFTSIKETSVDEDNITTIFKENSITIEFREYKNDYSSRQFSILVYNSTALYQEIQILKEQAEALKKAEVEQKKIYDNAIAEGDVLFSSSKFESAKIKYLTALEVENNILVQSKIKITEKKILDGKINTIQSKADLYFNDKIYDLALDNYNSILLLDKSNVYASEKIMKIQEIKYWQNVAQLFSHTKAQTKMIYYNFKTYCWMI